MKIGCVIINSKYSARQQCVKYLEDFFKDTGVEVEIVDGVFTDEIYHDARFDYNSGLSKGQIGASLAHFSALKKAVEKNYDYVFIFEDDVDIVVESYSKLKEWLDNLPEYDLCLMTNVGWFEGVGHDGRVHKNTEINDCHYVPCCNGVQSYYLRKEIITLMYETQKKHFDKKKLFIADGLHIHCEKNKDEYLKVITPKNQQLLFKTHWCDSIVNNL
jgi:hypothetical protein